jgi:DnaK suppressor protein
VASKKPASKPKKVTKPAATRTPAHKSAAHKAAAHKAEVRRTPASSHRAAPARKPTKPAAPARSGAGGRAAAKTTAHGAPRPIARTSRPAAQPAPAVAAKAPGPKASLAKASVSKTPAAKAPLAVALPAAIPPLRPNRKPGVIAIGVPSRTGPRPVIDVEEGDGLEPGSLLSGPRNVKPYIARRGEQYMGKQQLGHFQQILATWKQDLMAEVDRTVTHMKDEAANFPDPNDRATQEEEFSLELRTRDRERKLIRKIEEALKRIEDGSYGYCLETGEEIGIKRLEARPVATLSIEAQERRERRERQYGDRDDRYR